MSETAIDHNDSSFKKLAERTGELFDDKTVETCRTKFNVNRMFESEPHVPDYAGDEHDTARNLALPRHCSYCHDPLEAGWCEHNPKPETKSHNLTVMHSSDRMDWGTDPKTFAWLDAIYHFTLDAAANEQNHKCATWLGDHGDDGFLDALTNSWGYHRTFLNPPYGRGMMAWITKCIMEAQRGATVVALVPSRTGSQWFRSALIEAQVRMDLYGREKFVDPSNPTAKAPAPFDSTILVFAPTAHDAKAWELDKYKKAHVERLYVSRSLQFKEDV